MFSLSPWLSSLHSYNLIEGITGDKTVIFRKTLVRRIEMEFAAMKENLTACRVQSTTVRATVTNNGSNCAKAFHEFEATEEAAPDDFDDEIRFFDMDAVLEMEGDDELLFYLPPNQRCATYCTCST